MGGTTHTRKKNAHTITHSQAKEKNNKTIDVQNSRARERESEDGEQEVAEEKTIQFETNFLFNATATHI